MRRQHLSSRKGGHQPPLLQEPYVSANNTFSEAAAAIKGTQEEQQQLRPAEPSMLYKPTGARTALLQDQRNDEYDSLSNKFSSALTSSHSYRFLKDHCEPGYGNHNQINNAEDILLPQVPLPTVTIGNQPQNWTHVSQLCDTDLLREETTFGTLDERATAAAVTLLDHFTANNPGLSSLNLHSTYDDYFVDNHVSSGPSVCSTYPTSLDSVTLFNDCHKTKSKHDCTPPSLSSFDIHDTSHISNSSSLLPVMGGCQNMVDFNDAYELASSNRTLYHKNQPSHAFSHKLHNPTNYLQSWYDNSTGCDTHVNNDNNNNNNNNNNYGFLNGISPGFLSSLTLSRNDNCRTKNQVAFSLKPFVPSSVASTTASSALPLPCSSSSPSYCGKIETLTNRYHPSHLQQQLSVNIADIDNKTFVVDEEDISGLTFNEENNLLLSQSKDFLISSMIIPPPPPLPPPPLLPPPSAVVTPSSEAHQQPQQSKKNRQYQPTVKQQERLLPVKLPDSSPLVIKDQIIKNAIAVAPFSSALSHLESIDLDKHDLIKHNYINTNYDQHMLHKSMMPLTGSVERNEEYSSKSLNCFQQQTQLHQQHQGNTDTHNSSRHLRSHCKQQQQSHKNILPLNNNNAQVTDKVNKNNKIIYSGNDVHETQQRQPNTNRILKELRNSIAERSSSPSVKSAEEETTVAATSTKEELLRCLDEEERFVLHLAILTLYKDQIKPQFIEIRHRLEELHCSPFLELNFLKLYEVLDTQYLVEHSETPSVAAVYLRDTPNWFSGWIDMRDAHNPYPLHVWVAFDAYMVELLRATPPADAWFALEARGGRYGLSKRLKTSGPPVFRRYSLGQICHMVQLAVHLGVLAYEGGSLVPTACCRSAVRKLFPPEQLLMANRAAACCRSTSNQSALSHDIVATVNKASITNEDDERMPHFDSAQIPVVTDWQEVHQALETLLSTDDFKPMLLSQLKFKFLHKFHKRLDPLVFGFSRLSDFLADRCSHYCRLVREGGRQVIVDRVVLKPPSACSIIDSDNHGVEDLNETSAKNVKGVTTVCSRNETEGISSMAASPVPSTSDLESDRATRGLLGVITKHYRFHYNLTYSFWQFLTDVSHRRSTADASSSSPSMSSLLFCPAAKFTDSLFASVLRPASIEPSHFVQCQQTVNAATTDIIGETSITLPSLLSQQQKQELSSSCLQNVSNAEDGSFNSSLKMMTTDHFDSSTTNNVSSPAATSFASQMYNLRWFSRQPLLERQLGQGKPLSFEDCEALANVFFAVLPPRLPLISALEAPRAPRPSKLRRQITFQIAQLRREMFFVDEDDLVV